MAEAKSPHKNAGSTSSSSSGEDFFQFTPTDLAKSPSAAPIEQELKISPPDEKSAVRPVTTPPESPVQETPMRMLGLNQTPPSIEGYDPNRIPASVFARKPSPKDWSTASNESLFSIQMGNSSFSKDQAFLFNASPEMPPPPRFRSGEIKDPLKSVAEEQAVAHDGIVRSSGSSRSDASSIQSFAFPILPGGLGSMKVVPEQVAEKLPPPPEVEAEPPKSPSGPPKPPAQNKWFCFSCCSCSSD